jgi:hypothetical protein
MRGAGFRSTFLAALLLLAPAFAAAQTPAELSEARKTFTSALADEEHGNFEVALEKFRRVQAVRETVAVRYRVGACLEALGRLKEAIVAYEGAIALGSGGDPGNAESIKAARAKVADIGKRMPQLSLTVSETAPPGVEVELDHEVVPAAALRAPILVDPGPHVVSANAPGATPFRTDLTLQEGAHLALAIPLVVPPPVIVPPSAIAPPKEVPPESSERRPNVAGWIAVGAGAALLVGAGAFVLVRHGEISDLNRACTGGVCPRSREAELTSLRSHAVTNGTIGAALAGAGVVAAGVGAYLLLVKGGPAVSASVSATDARLIVRGSF